MSVSQDLLFENLSTVQGSLSPLPKTIVAATTIAPETFVTIITGTTNVSQITPPITNAHMLCLWFTDANPGDLVTGGNIIAALTSIPINRPVLVIYNPLTAKYAPVMT